jgi:hypothetical protein
MLRKVVDSVDAVDDVDDSHLAETDANMCSIYLVREGPLRSTGAGSLYK